ncbi:phosphorylase family protein [Natronorubrum sulfidifaciens]|uniref:Purine nucleoside permease n=1 Tax=Natronorubrum sulfidifaciens JCM 14089 TaxID=1230460 RepID=L9W7Q6_9EURY|nr:purine nucleoside permease [Natronorubrum sulfidifaciens]ELY44368.1 purine nucleoside permease [Natronorubrum sulfidifaciens JCM 14089]
MNPTDSLPEPRDPDPSAPVHPAGVVLPAVAESPLDERAPWLERYEIVDALAIPGTETPLYLTASELAITTTGIGKSDAATTVTALLASPGVDLDSAYVVSSGIAGSSPETTALGSVAIADAVVDWDRKHRWDRQGTSDTETVPGTGSESTPIDLLAYRPRDYVHHLEPAVVDCALTAAETVALRTDDAARDYQTQYPAATEAGPSIERGTTVCGDEFWHGPKYAREVEWLCGAYGVAPYVTTQMEDAATATALERFDRGERYLSVRAVANYDRPAPGQSVEESFDGNSASLELAIDNAARVGSAVIEALVASDPLAIGDSEK